ncbi:MAG: homoserine kinase [Acidobacteria bacterium]|nr:homoserine kinase [Acidobacteriota bacterium]
MKEVTVRAPATVSNVVCGFDCLGFAIDEPFDEVTVRRRDEPGIAIVHKDEFGLPTDPRENVAGVAVEAMLAEAGADFGVEIEIEKAIKPGSGIGSSGASSCGAVVATNWLLEEQFPAVKLIEFAMEGERLASGARHADNVAPCILGGFVLVRSIDPIDVVRLDFPPLFATVIHPQIEVKTAEARAVLPDLVPLRSAVRNWSNLGALVAALEKGDYELIGRSLVDEIVEPARRGLIPHFDEAKAAGLAAGAIGGGISGSGPSIFMLSKTRERAEIVRTAMGEAYESTGIPFNTYLSEIGPQGASLR